MLQHSAGVEYVADYLVFTGRIFTIIEKKQNKT